MSLHYSTLLLTLAASSLTALAQSTAHYAVNVEKNQTITHPNRQLRSVSLQSADGLQTQTVGTRLVYNDLSAKTFTALPGDAVHLSLDYQSGAIPWMHSYVYVDLNSDGKFDSTELLSYSYSQGKNSLGKNIEKGAKGSGSSLPPFSCPKRSLWVNIVCA